MNKATQKVRAQIKQEWKECELLKLFEFQLKDDEYLCVELELLHKGISFSFVEEHPTHFSGGVVELSEGHYLIPFDEYIDSLDSYLELIHDELTEGYLLPNDMIQ